MTRPERPHGLAIPIAVQVAVLMAALILLPSPSVAREVIEGRVVAVHDGDTISVLVERTQTRIRLAGIDTPERGQPWGSRAKQALSARVSGKDVRIIAIDVDRYGRTIGEVYADDVCVGCELVREGHAWVYRRYSDDEVLIGLEDEARAAGRGLWGLPDSERVPPWQWRRTRSARKRDASARPAAHSFECGAKLYCREMAGCAEARFHLEECGLRRLDGDADGIPCEQLCAGR